MDAIKIILLGIAILVFGITIAVIGGQTIAFYINLVGILVVIGGILKGSN